MKLRCVLAVFLGSLLWGGAAAADCFHNGETVPEGTQVGGLVCKNGQWVSG